MTNIFTRSQLQTLKSEISSMTDVWRSAIEHELIIHNIGVANPNATFDEAREAIHALIDMNIQIATDQLVDGEFALTKIEQSTANEASFDDFCCVLNAL